MDANRVIIEVNGQKLHLVLNKTWKEWLDAYTNPGDDYWDVLLEELLDGTLDINEDIWYWYINGRCCETNEEVED